jgi:2,5-diketo-D-gluconate reductase A
MNPASSDTSMAARSLQLNDGRTIPQIGLGVFKVAPGQVADTVRAALDAGYRHFDLAAFYENEEPIGRALAECGVPREELFLTSKVWNDGHGRQKALAACQESLDRIGVDHLDLYLIHWPVPSRDMYVETWETLVDLREAGRVTSIGTANFLPEHLDRLADEVGVMPAVNQIELHPWLQQRELLAHHDAHGIVTQAWSPLGRGAVLDEPVLKEIARRRNATVAQVVLRWHVDNGVGVVPKSVTPDRIRANIQLDAVQVSEADRVAIGQLDRGQRTGPDPRSHA